MEDESVEPESEPHVDADVDVDVDANGSVGTGGEEDVEPEPCAGSEPSDSLSMFGTIVKGLREHAGLSREEFGRRVGFSKHTVASIEQGRRVPDWDFVTAADPALGFTDLLHEAFGKVSREPAGLAAWFRRWAWYEKRAVSLFTYECRLVPGLLQTRAYARTLFENQVPLWDDEQIEAQLAARTERQRLLRERPHTLFSFVLEEHLLQRQVGGREAMREQVEHLLALTALRNVEIQIMPAGQMHAGLGGPLRLLETPDIQRFAYCEGQESGQYISDPKVVSTLNLRYARMRSQALTRADSIALLERKRGTL